MQEGLIANNIKRKRTICLKTKKKYKVEYNTDKKELVRETSWIRAKKNGKRKNGYFGYTTTIRN